MNKLFVTYQMALRFKALGFNEPCLATYVQSEFLGYPEPTFCLSSKENIEHGNTKNSNHFISMPSCASAPTIAQAFAWMRDNYMLGHQPTRDGGEWHFNIVDYSNEQESSPQSSLIHVKLSSEDYEDVELACLDKMLEIIEQES